MKIFAGGQGTKAGTPTSPPFEGRDRPLDPDPSPKGPIGWIVAGSLIAGGLAALLLAAAPIVPATESGVTGAILLGFALGWAMLAGLSARFTNQPQWWALAPALVMGLGGFLLLAFGAPAHDVLAWVWPPIMLALAIWIIVRVHQDLRNRAGRILVYPVIALLILVSLGSGFETVSQAMMAGAQPAQGQLIDVGGHRLYLDCTGSGSPTVVLEPGAGLKASDLEFIAPAVARETRVCVYDRAGRGRSDPAKTSQDGAQPAIDLHTLLQRANEPGPYVLAGHSFGGLYALTFAALYPDDVAGLVLVDSTAPASHPEPATTQSARSEMDDTNSRLSALGAAAANLGIGRVIGVDRPSQLWGTIYEYLHAGSFAQEAAALKDLDGKPLFVLTAGSGNQPGWDAKQDALAALSTNSVHRVIDGATHQSLILDQEDAAATTQGILEVVSVLRTGNPLVP